MRAYCLQIQWFVHCLWKTWKLQRRDKGLKKKLLDVYSPFNDRREKESFPKTISCEINGESYFIHAYWLKSLSNAYKTYIGAQLIKNVQIIGPETLIVLVHNVVGRYCILLFQKTLHAKRIKSWNPEMGYQLADELRKWHGIRDAGSNAVQSIFTTNDANWITKKIKELHFSPYLQCLKNYSQDIINQACSYLTQAELIGPLALCHGDIHRGNLLRNERGDFVWLDLDAMALQPIFQELAWLQFFILARHPDAAISLENTYFEDKLQLYQVWKQFRLHWCVIQGVYHAAQLLRVGSCLPGHKPVILKHKERSLKSADQAFRKAVLAQKRIETHNFPSNIELNDLLAYLRN